MAKVALGYLLLFGVRVVTPAAVAPNSPDQDVDGWSYFGCYSYDSAFDSFNGMTFANNDPDVCASHCAGSHFFGLYDSSCYCGDGDGPAETTLSDESTCNIGCPGDLTLSCGGASPNGRKLRRRGIPADQAITLYKANPAPDNNVPGWTYAGCYYSPTEFQAYSDGGTGDDNSPAHCAAICQGSTHFALYETECRCGSDISDGTMTADGLCTAPCPGNTYANCGDPAYVPTAIEVFVVYTVPTSASASTTASITLTTTISDTVIDTTSTTSDIIASSTTLSSSSTDDTTTPTITTPNTSSTPTSDTTSTSDTPTPETTSTPSTVTSDTTTTSDIVTSSDTTLSTTPDTSTSDSISTSSITTNLDTTTTSDTTSDSSTVTSDTTTTSDIVTSSDTTSSTSSTTPDTSTSDSISALSITTNLDTTTSDTTSDSSTVTSDTTTTSDIVTSSDTTSSTSSTTPDTSTSDSTSASSITTNLDTTTSDTSSDSSTVTSDIATTSDTTSSSTLTTDSSIVILDTTTNSEATSTSSIMTTLSTIASDTPSTSESIPSDTTAASDATASITLASDTTALDTISTSVTTSVTSETTGFSSTGTDLDTTGTSSITPTLDITSDTASGSTANVPTDITSTSVSSSLISTSSANTPANSDTDSTTTSIATPSDTLTDTSSASINIDTSSTASSSDISAPGTTTLDTATGSSIGTFISSTNLASPSLSTTSSGSAVSSNTFSGSVSSSSLSASPSVSATNQPFIPPYRFLGCEGSAKGYPGLSEIGKDDNMTPNLCVSMASGQNYIGVFNNTCYGGDSLDDTTQVATDECNLQCPGDSLYFCGGTVRTASRLVRRAAPGNTLLTVYVKVTGTSTVTDVVKTPGAADTVTISTPDQTLSVTTTITEEIHITTTITYKTIATAPPYSIITTEYCATLGYSPCPVCPSPSVEMTTYLAACDSCGKYGQNQIWLTVPVAAVESPTLTHESVVKTSQPQEGGLSGSPTQIPHNGDVGQGTSGDHSEYQKGSASSNGAESPAASAHSGGGKIGLGYGESKDTDNTDTTKSGSSGQGIQSGAPPHGSVYTPTIESTEGDKHAQDMTNDQGEKYSAGDKYPPVDGLSGSSDSTQASGYIQGGTSPTGGEGPKVTAPGSSSASNGKSSDVKQGPHQLDIDLGASGSKVKSEGADTPYGSASSETPGALPHKNSTAAGASAVNGSLKPLAMHRGTFLLLSITAFVMAL